MIAYSLLDEEDPEIVLSSGWRPMAEREIYRRQERTVKQIDAISKGLLEVSGQLPSSSNYFRSKVGFLHRTVKELLLENQSVITSSTNQGFQAEGFICLALLGEFKSCPMQDQRRRQYPSGSLDYSLSTVAKKILVSARQAELVTGEAQSAVLDELERSISQIQYDFPNLHLTSLLSPWSLKRDAPAYSSILQVCVTMGLSEYVKLRISRDPSVVKDEFLLVVALKECAGINFTTHSTEMLQLLLDKGADPNQTSVVSTIFGEYLYDLGDEDFAKPIHMRITGWKRLYRDLDLLFQSGADPNVARKGDIMWGSLLLHNRPTTPTNRDYFFRIIQSFIDYGANPNLPFRGSTIWGQFLLFLGGGLGTASELEEDRAFNYRLVDILVLAGAELGRYANKDTVITSAWERSSTELEMIRSYFAPQQAKQLEETMLRERSKRRHGSERLSTRSNVLKKLRMKWSHR